MWGWVKPLLEVLLNFFWGKSNESRKAEDAGRDDALMAELRKRVQRTEDGLRDGRSAGQDRP